MVLHNGTPPQVRPCSEFQQGFLHWIQVNNSSKSCHVSSIIWRWPANSNLRERGTKIRMNSLSPSMWFDGLIPCAEDWHTKVIFLKVIIIINGIRIRPYILKYIKHIQTCLHTSIYIYIYTPLSCRWFGSTTTTENQHRSMVLCINYAISSTSPMLVLSLKKLQLLWGFLSVDCSWPPCRCINGYPEHGVKTRSTNFGSCFRLNRKVDWTKREQETGIINCVQESCWKICLISVSHVARFSQFFSCLTATLTKRNCISIRTVKTVK